MLTRLEQSIPRQLQADLLLIPAAFPGSIPSTHFWVFQELLPQCWVQFKVFMPVPKACGALPLQSAVTLFIQHTTGSPMDFSCWPSGTQLPEGRDTCPGTQHPGTVHQSRSLANLRLCLQGCFCSCKAPGQALQPYFLCLRPRPP